MVEPQKNLIQKTLKELTFVDGPNPELALDGRNQGGTLEGGAGEGFEGMGYLGDIRDDDEVSQWRAVKEVGREKVEASGSEGMEVEEVGGVDRAVSGRFQVGGEREERVQQGFRAREL